MKRIIYMLLAAILLISLVSCTKTADNISEGDSDVGTSYIEDISKRFIEQLAKQDFTSASSNFNQEMKIAIPVDKLQETWNGVINQFGDYQKQEEMSVADSSDEHRTVTVVTNFKNAKLDIKITFNKENKIAGLYFNPHTDVENSGLEDLETNNFFSETEVKIGEGEWILPGTLTLPKGDGPFPLVILVHGSGANDRDETNGPNNKPFKDLAHGLAAKGVAVYRYDKRTLVHGMKIAENIENFTVEQETIEDAISAVNKLSKNSNIDKNKIYVLGHSLGGTLIPRINTNSDKIAGFIMMAGANRPIEDLMLEQYTYIFSSDGDISEAEQAQLEAVQAQIDKVKEINNGAEVNPKDMILGAPANYWLDLSTYNPIESAKKIDKPLLILQGERDYQVTMEDYNRWKGALADKTNVQFTAYKKLNHLFFEGEGKITPNEYQKKANIPDYVINDIATWLNNQ